MEEGGKEEEEELREKRVESDQEIKRKREKTETRLTDIPNRV